MNDFKNRGWAGHLKKHIKKEHKNSDKNPFGIKIIKNTREKNRLFKNFAIPGNNSVDLLDKLKRKGMKIIEKNKDRDYTIIIAIGTNDSQIEKFKIIKSIEENKFSNNIKKILKLSKKLSKRVIVIGLLPVDELKTAYEKRKSVYVNDRIKRYNEILKESSKKENVEFVDFYMDWMKKDYKKLLSDGLHPNIKGHKLIFEKIKPIITH